MFNHPQLSFPGDVTHGLRHGLDQIVQLAVDAGLHLVAPGALEQHAPSKTAARLGDRTPSHTSPTGMLKRRLAKVGHQLPLTVEADELTDLSDHRDSHNEGDHCASLASPQQPAPCSSRAADR